MRLASLIVGLVSAGCGFSVPGGAAPDDGDPDAPGDMQTDTPDDGELPDTPDPPLCADGDSDGDGTCNFEDACAGFNDALDEDVDTIPDGCDDWPCGPTPVAPGASVSWTNTFSGETENVTVSNTELGTSMTNMMVVAPGATFTVTSDYSIYDCICLTCRDQIQVGVFLPNLPTTTRCIYDANPPGDNNGTCDNGAQGSDAMITLTAPVAEGPYDIRFRRANQTAGFCATEPDWFDSVNYVPQATETIAKICVHAP